MLVDAGDVPSPDDIIDGRDQSFPKVVKEEKKRRKPFWFEGTYRIDEDGNEVVGGGGGGWQGVRWLRCGGGGRKSCGGTGAVVALGDGACAAPCGSGSKLLDLRLQLGHARGDDGHSALLVDLRGGKRVALRKGHLAFRSGQLRRLGLGRIPAAEDKNCEGDG